MVALDIKMPKSCAECLLTENVYCHIKDDEDVCDFIDNESKPSWCPLIDLTQYEDDLK